MSPCQKKMIKTKMLCSCAVFFSFPCVIDKLPFNLKKASVLELQLHKPTFSCSDWNLNYMSSKLNGKISFMVMLHCMHSILHSTTSKEDDPVLLVCCCTFYWSLFYQNILLLLLLLKGRGQASRFTVSCKLENITWPKDGSSGKHILLR